MNKDVEGNFIKVTRGKHTPGNYSVHANQRGPGDADLEGREEESVGVDHAKEESGELQSSPETRSLPRRVGCGESLGT